MTNEKKGPSKTTIKTADRYLSRMRGGERILRDSAGRVQWADGKRVGSVTLSYLMSERLVQELDTDLFGDRSRGQTIGLVS